VFEPDTQFVACTCLLSLQPTFGLGETRAQAFTQFLRRGVGERDDEDFLDGNVRFENQAQEDETDVVRLAGAGAGLDQHSARQRQRAPVEWLDALRGVVHADTFSTRRCGSSTPATRLQASRKRACAAESGSRKSVSRAASAA